MIVTVFRPRLNPGALEEYGPMAKRMSELAQGIAGYISHKGFVAEDGERVTIVEFASASGAIAVKWLALGIVPNRVATQVAPQASTMLLLCR